MMQRLQRQFVLSAMGAMFMVLVVIIGAINLTVFFQNQSRLDNTLNTLAEHNGTLPLSEPTLLNKERLSLNPETAYETAYFSVVFGPNNEVRHVDITRIASAHQEDAIVFARTALNTEKKNGYLHQFRYLVQDRPDGSHMIIFLNAQQFDKITHGFMLNSLAIALIGFLATTALIILFSQRAIQPFLENYRLQRRFITDAGHELKTPLAVISADVDIIELTAGGETEWTRSIHRQVDRMSSLVAELLKLATMEERGPISRNVQIDFSALVRETSESFIPMATRQDKRLEIRVEPVIDLYGDSQSLGNLVSVLVDNAIKYAPDSSVIEIVARPRGRKGAFLSVSNCAETPPNEAELNRLFERFYRADESRSRQSGGFGIGLSMAKAIVEAHQGRISVQVQGERVIFSITL